MEHEVLGIIPARGGSKGIPGKNLYPCAGHPLIWYAIEAARGSKGIARTILSTDDEDIAGAGRAEGVEVPFMRPAELAADSSPTRDVIGHALDTLRDREGYQPDIVVLLQPTAPLRTADDVDRSLALLVDGDCDSVVSVAEIPGHMNAQWQLVIEEGCLRLFTGGPLSQVTTARQQLKPTYTRDGSLYVFWRRTWEDHGNFYGDRVVPYIMPGETFVNIDTVEDLQAAEAYLLRRRAGAASSSAD